MILPRKRNQHLERDAWYRGSDKQDEDEALSSSILLTAAGKPLSRHPSSTLPVRRRDSEMVQLAPEGPEETENYDEASVTPTLASTFH